MREGLDWPWLAHGIFACVFGSLQSYLQAGGRLLRAHPGKERAIIQDHGGNWWRHGSLNADRDWHLGDTAEVAAAIREDLYRGENPPKEPFRCPQCSAIVCSQTCICGYVIKSSRPFRRVVQSDGTLIDVEGRIFKPRVIKQYPTTQRLWSRVYWRAKNTGTMTFRAAWGLFCHENHYYPPQNLKLMPRTVRGWFQVVKNVPMEELY